MSIESGKILGMDRDKLREGMREAASRSREQCRQEDTLVELAQSALDRATAAGGEGLTERAALELRLAQTAALVAIASELRSLRYVR